MLVGERIKDRRIALGLSKNDIAERLGKDSLYIDEVENLGNEIYTDVISDFAKALETTPGYLMGWED